MGRKKSDTAPEAGAPEEGKPQENSSSEPSETSLFGSPTSDKSPPQEDSSSPTDTSESTSSESPDSSQEQPSAKSAKKSKSKDSPTGSEEILPDPLPQVRNFLDDLTDLRGKASAEALRLGKQGSLVAGDFKLLDNAVVQLYNRLVSYGVYKQ